MLKRGLFKRGSVAVAMSLALGAGAMTGSSHADVVSSSTPESPSTAANPDFVRFREEFGLPSTDAALTAAEAANVLRNQFGVPLTPSELAELTSREQVQSRAGALFEDVNSRLDTTGGIWIDQKHGGRFVVEALPTLSTADRAAITAKVPPGGTIVFEPATHSARELRTWSDKLFAQLNPQAGPGSMYENLAALGLQLQGWGVQRDTNDLIVTLDHLPNDLTKLHGVWDQAAADGLAPPRDMVRFEAGTLRA